MTRTQWGRAEGQRLRRARKQYGQTQTQCAEELAKLGAPKVSQGTLSQWETSTSRPADESAIAAIAQYWEGIAAPAPPDDSATTSIEGTTEVLGAERDFEHLITPMTGERVLSDRQAAYVDGIITHSRSLRPYTPEDERMLRTAARILGLTEYLEPSVSAEEEQEPR